MIFLAYGIPLPESMKESTDQSFNETNNNTLQWPPPPAYTFLFNSSKTTVSPPKPDTPPTNVRFNETIENILYNESFF